MSDTQKPPTGAYVPYSGRGGFCAVCGLKQAMYNSQVGRQRVCGTCLSREVQARLAALSAGKRK